MDLDLQLVLLDLERLGSIITHPLRAVFTFLRGGEIEIVQSVNMQSSNQISLHTGSACGMPEPIAPGNPSPILGEASVSGSLMRLVSCQYLVRPNG